jgi:hypothetical protein
VPNADIANLCDYLVGAQQDGHGNLEAKRSCGLPIDDEFKFDWLLNRQV